MPWQMLTGIYLGMVISAALKMRHEYRWAYRSVSDMWDDRPAVTWILTFLMTTSVLMLAPIYLLKPNHD